MAVQFAREHVAATIGPSATLGALRRVLEVCPTETVIGVVDRTGATLGVVRVEIVRALPDDVVCASGLVVADVMTCFDLWGHGSS